LTREDRAMGSSSIVVPTSLAATVEAVNDAFFFGGSLSKSQRDEAAKWIAARQGLPGSYAGMFAPTPEEMRQSIRLFTGESVPPYAGARHVLGEEAARALILLGSSLKTVCDAMDRGSAEITRRLLRMPTQSRGAYCCTRCTPAVWRHMTAGGLRGADPERWLADGVKKLRHLRDGEGKWRVYPFHYTLLALSEIDLPAAVQEMRYAAKACEPYLKHAHKTDGYTARRRALAERILARC
jgi:hypothetical protein